jgi:hypothetical protein
MKRLMSYLSAAAVLVLFSGLPAYARVVAAEPGTMAVLGAVAAGGYIAHKILKRK